MGFGRFETYIMSSLIGQLYPYDFPDWFNREVTNSGFIKVQRNGHLQIWKRCSDVWSSGRVVWVMEGSQRVVIRSNGAIFSYDLHIDLLQETLAYSNWC